MRRRRSEEVDERAGPGPRWDKRASVRETETSFRQSTSCARPSLSYVHHRHRHWDIGLYIQARARGRSGMQSTSAHVLSSTTIPGPSWDGAPAGAGSRRRLGNWPASAHCRPPPFAVMLSRLTQLSQQHLRSSHVT